MVFGGFVLSKRDKNCYGFFQVANPRLHALKLANLKSYQMTLNPSMISRFRCEGRDWRSTRNPSPEP